MLRSVIRSCGIIALLIYVITIMCFLFVLYYLTLRSNSPRWLLIGALAFLFIIWAWSSPWYLDNADTTDWEYYSSALLLWLMGAFIVGLGLFGAFNESIRSKFGIGINYSMVSKTYTNRQSTVVVDISGNCWYQVFDEWEFDALLSRYRLTVVRYPDGSHVFRHLQLIDNSLPNPTSTQAQDILKRAKQAVTVSSACRREYHYR